MVVLDVHPQSPSDIDDWPVRWLCDVSTASTDVTGAAVSAATSILWAASGRRYGFHTATVRPCRLDETNHPSTWSSVRSPGDASSILATCGMPTCRNGCSCTSTSEVWLRPYLQSASNAVVGGVLLPASAYRVDNHHKIIRQDGGEWPFCQNIGSPLGDPGTWSIDIVYGIPVPTLGAMAVGELACIFVDALTDMDGCDLPASWSQVSREGVTITAIDLTVLAEQGLLGLDICDHFIRSVNPNGLVEEASVTSVDEPAPRYV